MTAIKPSAEENIYKDAHTGVYTKAIQKFVYGIISWSGGKSSDSWIRSPLLNKKESKCLRV